MKPSEILTSFLTAQIFIHQIQMWSLRVLKLGLTCPLFLGIFAVFGLRVFCEYGPSSLSGKNRHSNHKK